MAVYNSIRTKQDITEIFPQYICSARWYAYQLNLKVKDSTILVDFDDWMFLQDRNILINRAEVKKWGINVGVVTITFLKVE